MKISRPVSFCRGQIWIFRNALSILPLQLLLPLPLFFSLDCCSVPSVERSKDLYNHKVVTVGKF